MKVTIKKEENKIKLRDVKIGQYFKYNGYSGIRINGDSVRWHSCLENKFEFWFMTSNGSIDAFTSSIIDDNVHMVGEVELVVT